MLEFGFYNMDCIEGMKQFPDKYFDLAVVDPPYGIGYDADAQKVAGTMFGKSKAKKSIYHTANWDAAPPNDEYFIELFRVSKNQVIWGGNYFKQLPPSRSFICWDKKIGILKNNFSDCEYAWMNPELGVARIFRYLWAGMLQQEMKNKENRIHPTQKPVALYEWILNNYASKDDIILDTHVGSASSLIACRNTGHKYVGFEIDPVYYAKAKERLDRAEAQTQIFDFIKE